MATKKRIGKSGRTAASGGKKDERSGRQMSAIILFACGVLLLAVELIPGPGIWAWLKGILFGFFGFTAYILPVILIYIAIMAALDKPIGEIKHKVWQTGVFVCLISGIAEIFAAAPFAGTSFFDSVKVLYENGNRFGGGGVFSAVLGWPLLALCGKAGSLIILFLLLFVFLMLLTGATLMGFFRGVAKPVKQIERSYTQMRETREKNKKDFNIDVDLGPEPVLPEHPVSSKKPSLDELLALEQKHTEETIKRAEDASRLIALSERMQQPGDFSVPEPVKEPAIPMVQEPPANGQTRFYTDENNVINQYVYPPSSLLKAPHGVSNRDVSEELSRNADLLVETLKSFGVQTRIVNVSRGPTVTRYELQPSAGVKISKITNLADDIALNLSAAGVRIEAPIPGKPAVGIEVPNRTTDIVAMREIIESKEFEEAESRLSAALGKDIAGNCIVADISKMPHMLIAGATGSGKSVCINSIIMSLLYKASPSEVRLVMIDPKVVELGVYNGIPHLLVPVVTDPRKAAGALSWAVTEMLNRYKRFSDNNVRDLYSYNLLAQGSDEVDPMPQIVIIIDELADLMMAAPNEVEDSVCRLAQMARAAGMHLIIATQRPSVDVITGVIKANIPSRIAFAVSSQVDSRTILDGSGAEKLIGRGDMLFYPMGLPKPLRVQGCFVSDREIEQVVNFIKNKERAEYDEKIIEEIDRQAVPEKGAPKDSGGGFEDTDGQFSNAIECVIEAGQASTSYLQRKLKVGYARAARLIDEMEAKGIIGPFEGSKPRQVLITRQQWIEMQMNRLEAGDKSRT